MKKIIGILIAISMIFGITSCGNDKNEKSETQSAEDSTNIVAGSSEDSQSEEGKNTGAISGAENNHILIAYFTWADNTHVENPDSIDVDATTSASVIAPGNTAKLAAWIQEEAGGDLFSITTVEPYSSDYDECLERAIEEHDSGILPELTDSIENIDDYDIVFLGFPNWWYSCPMAILSFIQENDLSGKTIIPFCSHGTGGFAASLQDIGNALPEDCTVLQEFGAYRPEVDQARPDLSEWLKELPVEF